MTEFFVEGAPEEGFNHMAAVYSSTPYEAFRQAGNYSISVPFDNDAWVRYVNTPFRETPRPSFEVTALINADTRRGVILGSVEHDIWKTGIDLRTSGSCRIDSLSVFGGIANELSRDIIPHGAVRGKCIKSPRIMLGDYADWRDGMEAYGDLCTLYAPRIESRGPRPFGWNSWGNLQTKINYKNCSEVSDFIHDELQNCAFADEDGTVYIGLDAFWDFGFNMDELRKFAEHCKKNGQKAGIYFCPFTDWGKNPEATVAELPEYKYKDTYLYGDGKILEFDGAYAMDPTHPATKARIAKNLNDFKDWGYEYVKIDFMAHGAYEADHHFDPSVTTGVAAYNHGMAYIDSIADGKLWINLSIAPVLPGNFAHSRRIGCDAWASIDNTEYSLNSLTYSWWLDHIYHFNDADHIVLNGVTDGENRARLTSSALTGVFLLGDDFSSTGDADVKARAVRNATNKDINDMARRCKSFRPVELGTSDRAANKFVSTVGDTMYLAVFNFNDTPLTEVLPLRRLGLSEGMDYNAIELWSHDRSTLHGSITTIVPPRDVKVYRINLPK